jgi:lipid A 3-O-deacylase
MPFVREIFFKTIFLLLVLQTNVCHAKVDWLSFTWDNDIFLREDNGYTNGGFWTWFDTGRRSDSYPEPFRIVKPLMWSMSDEAKPVFTVNAHTFGHMMVTPDDITRVNPDPNDIPYSGLAYYFNSHLKVYEHYADLAGVTIGLIGPNSGAESMQQYIHRHIGGNDLPRGWDTQLDNELVFRLTRSRVWRTWRNDLGDTDFLMAAGANIGTLETSVGGYAMIRYGSDLGSSYATAAYHGSRAVNPVAINGGWHVYAGLSIRYVGHLIFTDGNTFKDSRSVEVDPGKIGYTIGASYSWQSYAVGLAIENMAMNEEQYDSVEQYGSMTLAYRFE